MSTHSAPGNPKVSSPAASGPAGSLFEGQVGAHYLLTMLAEADARGLPGVSVQRVQFQRAAEGHPLDDVIVHGTTQAGQPAVLEIQVKRTVSFAPADSVFKDVVEQLARAIPNLDLTHQRHQFAVAIERTAFKISGPYQDVLRWAREIGSAATFIARIKRKHVGNDDMRNFVKTVRDHLSAAGSVYDDETVWQILRRFHILPFDYDAPGSQSHELAIERARHVLDPDDVAKAGALWSQLTEIAIRAAASGGEFDRVGLVTELTQISGFRLLGSRPDRTARQALSDAALLTASAFQRGIAGVTLARTAQLAAVREARDVGRYIEIRGGPGVGKSGLLGMLVQQVSPEARAIVLSPERTTPGGWLQFRAVLGIQASPHAFLADLAADGGAVLFVDSLDFYRDPDKRATVIDLVRAAVDVPGFQVIVTARTNFDVDEPNWLPADILDRLGRATPVILNELGAEEIEELRFAAPMLRALLADNHPARELVRNLFRLSRLLEVRGSAADMRTEGDLLLRWWTTADGAPEGHRERGRLLVDLSEAALAGADHIDCRPEPAAAKALIDSESVRELSFDRFSFAHDVLREWGMAALLYTHVEKLDSLPHVRPASMSLARGVELGARLVLERSSDAQGWISYINRVSQAEAHASWRRFSMLGILRSELSSTLLDRAAPVLFENDGKLLRELIRTAIGAEGRPLESLLAEHGQQMPFPLAGMFVPANASWTRLTLWLLVRRADLPLQSLPDVVDLFRSLAVATFLDGPLATPMAMALAEWLTEIDEALDYRPWIGGDRRLLTAFTHQDLHALGDDARHTFALLAAKVPTQAQAYLRSMLKLRNSDETIRDLMRFRGSFAKAAPAELVELALAGLLPSTNRPKRGHEPLRDEVFTHLDTDFLPSSPAQGPFFDLLNASPEHGLGLIRRLVDYAVRARSRGTAPKDDGFTLVFASGPRFFPWQQTYYWSRDAGGCYAVESALMALEAWSHARMERGDAAESVIADILGPDGSPAAYLLVAVDVLISHWPKTVAAIAPFLGTPELLSADRTRQARDAMPEFQFPGWSVPQPKEPVGLVTLASLKERASRQVPLETLLGHFTHRADADREALRAVLCAAAERLGSPEPNDTFAEARMMARFALNLTDKANWQREGDGFVYVSPPDEARHVEALEAGHANRARDLSIDTAIQAVLEDASKSSLELAERAVEYAKRLETSDAPVDAISSPANTIVSAAMIMCRDGSDQLFDRDEAWAREVFAKALAVKERDVGRSMRGGIRYNPVATTAVGIVHLWRRRKLPTDRDALLELAGRDTMDAAQGFGAAIDVIRGIDRRMVTAVLRCALAAQIHPLRRSYDAPEADVAADQTRYRERVRTHIEAERAWLDNAAGEPAWPAFPPPILHIRRGFYVDGSDTDEHDSAPSNAADEVYAQSAALWLTQLARDTDEQSWYLGFISAYGEWTAHANGAGQRYDVEVNGYLGQWNRIFCTVLAEALPGMTSSQAKIELARAIDVPDRSFFEVAENLLPALDIVYFEGRGLNLETALELRSRIADRLSASTGWRRERDRTELVTEMWIGAAIGAVFFNFYSSFEGSRCYLGAKGIDQIDPFLSQLSRVIDDGPVPFTAMLTMNLLEVCPKPEHAGFLLSSAQTWLRRQPTNTTLWVDNELGGRIARWLEAVTAADPSLRASSHPLRAQIDAVLGRLIQQGVADAHRVEQALAAAKS